MLSLSPDSGLLPGADDGAMLAQQQYLRFSLGHDMHALRIEAVREILEVAQMTPLPLMPDFMRGVMNLRGAVVPVIDLSARLGLPATAIGRRTCVVIVDVAAHDDAGKPQTMGVLVDAVYEVFACTSVDTEPVPRLGTRIAPEFIRSMVRIHDEATPELDLAAVLAQTALSELIASHMAAH
jgi:purine-binding chemotaxis protein CheW